MRGFLGSSVIKNPPANAGDRGLIPGLGRSPGEGNDYHSSILAWEIPRTEPGGLQSAGLKRVRHSSTEQTTAMPNEGYFPQLPLAMCSHVTEFWPIGHR